jgi:uncharacterized membrane protein YjjP (DUF1212 family)
MELDAVPGGPHGRRQRGTIRGVPEAASAPPATLREAAARGVADADRDDSAFVLRLARALHRNGYASHQLEATLVEVSERLGLAGQFFAMPTGLIAAFGQDRDQRTHLLRFEPGAVELGRLGAIDEVRQAVVDGRLAPEAAAERLDRLESCPPLYGRMATTAAYPLSSAAAACFLGGGWGEISAAACCGLLVGLLALVVTRQPPLARLFETLAGLLAAALAVAWSVWLTPVATTVVTIAGLIVLVPGLTLTVAVTELASRHLAAGTARLMGAILVFLSIGFGVALGRHLGTALWGGVATHFPELLPVWVEGAALLIAALAYAVVLGLPLREIPWILAAGVVAVQGTRLGVSALGPELGAFVGALLVGMGSNLLARQRRRPAALTLVPGILLLVPGSVGVKSIAAFLERETLTGIAIGFQMALVAVALATGLLLASALVSPERRRRRPPRPAG